MKESRDNTDDGQLVKRCQQGEIEALRQLYDRHNAYLYAVVRRLTGNDADAEDIVQEAFVRAWKGIVKFRGSATFRTWLVCIGVNLSRRLKRRQKNTTQLGELPAPSLDLDALAQHWLDRALEQLPRGYREVLVLHDVMEWRHREIAQVLGLRLGTSKSQLHRARAKMRELLAVSEKGEPQREANGGRRGK